MLVNLGLLGNGELAVLCVHSSSIGAPPSIGRKPLATCVRGGQEGALESLLVEMLTGRVSIIRLHLDFLSCF